MLKIIMELPEKLPIRPFQKPVEGSVYLPGSKSITNRALLMAVMSRGEVLLEGTLVSEDSQLMIEALQTLGVIIEREEETRLKVCGVEGVFPVKKADIFVGTAGTVARLLIAVLGVQLSGNYRVNGTEVMRGRPMKGLTDALKQLGTEIEFEHSKGQIPFVIKPRGFGSSDLKVDASETSQILSAAMMCAGLAKEKISIELINSKVRKAYVKMTQHMMADFGVRGVSWNDTFTRFEIDPGDGYHRSEGKYTIESDASAASYFLSLPKVVGGALSVHHFDPDGLQGDVAYLKVLEELGAQAKKNGTGIKIGFSNAELKPRVFNFYEFSDTFMSLAAISPLFTYPIRIEGIAHTRRQESDRVSAMATELKKLGQTVEEGEDYLEVSPNRDALKEVAERGVEIETYKDHRIAMSFGILGCCDVLENGKPWMTVLDPGCCSKTFPEFFTVLDNLRD